MWLYHKYHIIDTLRIIVSVSGSLGTPHSTGSVAPCYYESSMIVVGVIFPHCARFVTFSFQKLERKKEKKSTAVSEGTSGCGRRLNAATAVFEFLNGWLRLPILSQHFVHSCESCETHDRTHMHVNCYISTRKASTKYKELSVRPTYCK